MSMRYYISTEEASFFINNRMGYANSIPTSGNYKVGDFIISSTQEDGIFGWVCTVAGTPGEWEVIGSGMGNSGSVMHDKVVGYINAVSFSDTRSSIEIGINEYEKGKDFLEVHYNGLMLAEGVHYNVSEDGKSIIAIDDVWNENADDTQQMIFRVIKSEGVNVKELKNTIDINSACYEVEMGIEGYSPEKDVVEVHLNGVLLVQGVDYEIVEGRISKKDRSEAWNPYNVNGQKMFVRVFRNIANLVEPSDGSVTMEKLSPDVRSDVAAIDGLVSSMSIQNSTISNLNDRVTAIEEKIESGDIVTNGSGGGPVKLTYKDNLVEVINTNTVAIGLPFNKEKDMLEVHIDGLKLAEGIHYNISEDGTSIVKVEGVWNPDSLEDQYIDFRVITAGNQQIDHLTRNVEFSSPMTEVGIELEYKHGVDILIVHLNGIKLVEGLDFEYVAEGNKIVKIDTSEPWNLYGVDGQLFVIDVLRNVGEKVTMDDLADDVKEAITHAGGSKLKGKTIVRFGDSITEDGAIVDETISALTGANIINVGVACARMTSDDSSQGYDGFSMTNLVFAYYNQKQGNENPWSYQESQNEITKGNGDDNTEILNRLKNIDFSQVDYVLISYGTNDFAGNVPLGGLCDSWWNETGKTFCGAVNFSVSMLLTMYPHLKIVFTSPTWRGRLYEDEITCDNAINSENLMLKHYVKSLKILCEKNHVQFIDLFNIGINEFNHAQYLWDRLHFNETGAALLGEYIANGLLNSSPMNEAEMITGDLNYLHTDDKTDLVAAINEVDVYVHDNIGDMENLQTTNKGNLVEAINEVEIEIVNIKNSLVDILNNKGISCSTDQSWLELFALLVNNNN